MSGPDDRRGTDGGEHPLDVDARFADIIAHFHDGEPSRPQLVDAPDGPLDDTVHDADHPDVPADLDGPDVPTSGAVLDLDRPDRSRVDRTDAARLADEAEAAAHRERLARIEAEVERAVHGSDGGHYVPPEPPPIPRPDLPGRLAWAGVLLGPVVLLLCALLWDTVRAPSWFVGAVVTAIVVGFGYLVYRLPRTRDRDDPDDGAIV